MEASISLKKHMSYLNEYDYNTDDYWGITNYIRDLNGFSVKPSYTNNTSKYTIYSSSNPTIFHLKLIKSRPL